MVYIISRYYLGANISVGLSGAVKWSARIPTRVAESSSNFEISGPAGLNVNMGIMLIAAVPSPLGHSSSTAVFWPLFAAVRTTYTDRWLRVRRWSRKTRRIWKSNFFYDFHAQERSESSSRKAIPVRFAQPLFLLPVAARMPNYFFPLRYSACNGKNFL